MDCLVVLCGKDVTLSILVILKIPICLGGRGKETPIFIKGKKKMYIILLEYDVVTFTR
jgi:hypothetical protein